MSILSFSKHHGKLSSDVRIYVKIRVHQHTLLALVDTGASRSLISKRCWDRIAKQQNRKANTSTNEMLVTLTGEPIPTHGKADITVENKVVSVFITDECRPDLLLGLDSLRILDAEIKVNGGSIVLNKKNFPFEECQDEDVIAAVSVGIETPLDVLMREFPSVFPKEGEVMPATQTMQMSIDVNGHPPIRQNAYRTPLMKRKVIEDEINRMLKEDQIQPSRSPWASPITLVDKKDGSTRFCVDYRKLNNVTVKETPILPHISDVTDGIGLKEPRATVFSLIDLKEAYKQMLIELASRLYTAFITHLGLYEFKRMPFGLTNAVAVWQRFMRDIFRPLIGECLFAYLDDITIFPQTMKRIGKT